MEHRTERVGHLIQQKIGSLILEGRIKDPRVSPFLSVTRVVVSRDLAYADVYVSNIKENGNIPRGVAGLQSAAGFIQAELAAFMRIRKTPKLRFHPDLSLRESFELVQKIDKLVNHGSSPDNP
ncbi:MAG: 30S ribosome-binding factor RbfA [Treponema sp.]|nr:30S ribosome-binding factor RbfA [Treponema sp.]